jgi:ferredoxin
MSDTLHVVVDRMRCESQGLCVDAAPRYFDIDDDDKLVISDDRPPASARAELEAAVRNCPKQALSLVE